jgi:hypothetical protein
MGRQRAARLLSRWEEQQNRRLENKRKRKSERADLTNILAIGNNLSEGSFERQLRSRFEGEIRQPQNNPRLPHYCDSCHKLETPTGEPLTMRYLGSLPPNDARIFVERVSGLDLNYTDTLLLEQARRYLAGFFEEYREGQSRGFIDTVEGPRPFQPFDTYTVSNCVGINQALNMAMMQEVGPGLYTGPTKNPVADLDAMRAKVARALKLLMDSSNLLSRIIAGLEVTPEEAQALKARVDAGVEAFK